MQIRLGIVMDPIAQINIKKDSSLAMLLAAQERDWLIFYMEQQDLYSQNGQAKAKAKPLSVSQNPEQWYQLQEEQDIELASLDVILMRKDPPFDNEFIYSTYILEQAEQQGCLIVNRPQSLRDCNEKFFATQFAELCPKHLVSKRIDLLKDFHQQHQDVIFKPLDGMGGSAIFRCKADDPNVSVILETLTQHGQQQIMAQCYLPAIAEGDKRILMIDGQPVDHCLARIPAQGETRGNLAAGGTGRTQALSASDLAIAQAVGPSLRAKGLLFVGLDVIGDRLTEINVTSPTCIREISRDTGQDIAGRLMDLIAQKLAK